MLFKSWSVSTITFLLCIPTNQCLVLLWILLCKGYRCEFIGDSVTSLSEEDRALCETLGNNGQKDVLSSFSTVERCFSLYITFCRDHQFLEWYQNRCHHLSGWSSGVHSKSEKADPGLYTGCQPLWWIRSQGCNFVGAVRNRSRWESIWAIRIPYSMKWRIWVRRFLSTVPLLSWVVVSASVFTLRISSSPWRRTSFVISPSSETTARISTPLK